MNCANCLESEEDGHDSFVCEECQASSIDGAVEPFRDALAMLVKAVRAFAKSKDEDRVKEFEAMVAAEKTGRALLSNTEDKA